jgi:hypothetical protein
VGSIIIWMFCVPELPTVHNAYLRHAGAFYDCFLPIRCSYRTFNPNLMTLPVGVTFAATVYAVLLSPRWGSPRRNGQILYLCSPKITHHSPLTTHHSPLTTHHSPLTSLPSQPYFKQKCLTLIIICHQLHFNAVIFC